jgi:predicted transcriptional regulator
MEEEASRRFVDAWHRARRGKTFYERYLPFESCPRPRLNRQLLRYVHRHEVSSVRALAKVRGRDYSNVHSDVQALMAVGLLDSKNGGVRKGLSSVQST